MLGTPVVAFGLALSLVLARPVALIAIVVLIAVLVASNLSPRILIGGLIIYLTFEELVLTHVPSADVAYVRYAPEALLDLVAAILLITRANDVVARVGRGWVVMAVLLTSWVASAALNAVPLSTAAIGLRSELRFLPLGVIALLSSNAARDALRVARVIVFCATAEAVIGLAEAVGGAGVRAAFRPNWHIDLGGITFAQGRVQDRGIAFGTFSSHNSLGILLAFAWLVAIAAGAERLNLSSRMYYGCLALIGTASLVSGSRQAVLAILLASLIVARIRLKFPVIRVAAITLVVLVILGPAIAAVGRAAPSGAISYGSVSRRWEAVVSPATWRADQYSNFRLYLLKSDVSAAMQSPVVGFGLGTVSDQRWLADGRNAIYRTAAGSRAAAFSYVYDGNWALLVLEVGFLGTAAMLLLFYATARLGAGLKEHWLGCFLIGAAFMIPFLGFFAPIMQLRLPSAVFWALLGLALAYRHDLMPPDNLAVGDASSPALGAA